MRNKSLAVLISLLFLSFFSYEILAFSKDSGEEKVRVACIGNSITYGMKLENRDVESYPAQLQQLLGTGYEVGNFGRNSATLQYHGYLPYVEQPEFQEALAFKPDILVVHLGINDTDPRVYPHYSDEFSQDYVSLLDSFRKVNPSVRIIMANLSPILSTHRRFKSGTRAWRDSIRNVIPHIADYYGAELIDFGEVLRDRENLIPDGLHPDKEGASLLAKAVFSEITGDYGGLKMPPIYGNGMVLQRLQPLPISGRANAGDTVKVKIGSFSFRTVADKGGKWSVNVPPLSASSNIDFQISSPDKTLNFKDVAVGEVWVASGQSNMEFRMKNTSDFDSYKNYPTDSLLRFYDMKPIAYTDNQEWPDSIKSRIDRLDYYRDSSWAASSPETLPDLSAVAWHYAKVLRDSLDVPVGIISNSIGGSPVESWIDIESLEHGIPELLTDWRKNDYLQPWVQQRITENVSEPNLKHRHPYEPSYLFSTGIRPLGQYPIAGVIWYQGESNAHNVEVNEVLFPLLLESWRNYWTKSDLPFYFVQLSSIKRSSWPWFRDSQRKMALNLPYTGMAVSSDLGHPWDVHPKNKRPIGERLARLALNRTYGMNFITDSGPEIEKAWVEAPGRIRLTFRNAEGLKVTEGNLPGPFKIAGKEKIFQPVDSAFIEGSDIILLSDKNKTPKYVNYGWEPYTEANLVNKDNLPASTFMVEIEDMKENKFEEGIDKGISGGMAGYLGNQLVVAGGCNFPLNPMGANSEKKYYQGVYLIDTTGETPEITKRIGDLPSPMAYGGAVTLEDGILIAGGSNGSESFSDVYKLSLDTDGFVRTSILPSLPGPIDNFAMTRIGSNLYVAGGNVAGKPSNKLFTLNLDELSKGWKELKSFPGNPRVQPVMVGSKDKEGRECLYLWGGFAGKGDGREATLNTDGYKYDVKGKKWSHLESPSINKEDISLGGGAAGVLNDGRIISTGGVNKDIFLEALRNQAQDYLTHPIEWYKFNGRILIFDPKTEKWEEIEEDSRVARAGANLIVTPENEIILIGGELKPRIRTSDIYKKKID